MKLYEADSAEALLGGQAEYLLIFREVTQSDTAALQEGKRRITLDKPRAYALIQLQ